MRAGLEGHQDDLSVIEESGGPFYHVNSLYGHPSLRL